MGLLRIRVKGPHNPVAYETRLSPALEITSLLSNDVRKISQFVL